MNVLGTKADIAAPTFPAPTLRRLQLFLAVLERWNAAINLISPASLADVWPRHIHDSAQLLPLASPTARSWADLGSGGGFPGLIVAIIAAETAPDLRVTLVEADQRKASFLREASRQAEVEVRVIADRIEAIAPLASDVVSARAVAPLGRLWPLAARHLSPGGIALFPKGAGLAGELPELAQYHLDIETLPSGTDASARILRVKRAVDA